MDKVELKVTKTIDLTPYIEELVTDTAFSIGEAVEELVDDEEGIIDWDMKQVEKALVAGFLKGITEHYFNDED